MTEWKNFPKDFICNSKKNIENYKGEYEVTNLINNCLGLIIIPKERFGKNIPEYKFNNTDMTYGISKINITKSDDGYSLWQVVRHIRNGLAHGRIEQRTENHDIVGLRIHDKFDGSSPENFSIDFTIEEFKCFAFALSNMFLK